MLPLLSKILPTIQYDRLVPSQVGSSFWRATAGRAIDKPARVLIGMFTPRRHSIDSLLPGENGQSSKVPNWTEKYSRQETTPVETARSSIYRMRWKRFWAGKGKTGPPLQNLYYRT
jgi:hypothetical protein